MQAELPLDFKPEDRVLMTPDEGVLAFFCGDPAAFAGRHGTVIAVRRGMAKVRLDPDPQGVRGRHISVTFDCLIPEPKVRTLEERVAWLEREWAAIRAQGL